MAEDQKDRYIQYLAEQNQDLSLTGDAMKACFKRFYGKNEWVQKISVFFYENGSRGREVLTDFLGDAKLKSVQYNNSLHYGSDAGAEMAASYHSVIGTVSFMAVLSGTSSELFSKISLMGAGIMLTWFLTKSLWLPANVKFKTN